MPAIVSEPSILLPSVVEDGHLPLLTVLYHSFAAESASNGSEAAGAFQRSTGLRAAAVSSSRCTRVV